MLMEMLIYAIFIVFKVYGAVYIATCLHETGHAVAVKMMKGTINQVNFGTGKKVFHYKKLHVRIKPGGSVHWDSSEHHVLSRNEKVFICSAGVLTNSLVFWTIQLTISNISSTLTHLKSLPFISFLDLFCLVLVLELINLIPIKDSDGKQIKDLLGDKLQVISKR